MVSCQLPESEFLFCGWASTSPVTGVQTGSGFLQPVSSCINKMWKSQPFCQCLGMSSSSLKKFCDRSYRPVQRIIHKNLHFYNPELTTVNILPSLLSAFFVKVIPQYRYIKILFDHHPYSNSLPVSPRQPKFCLLNQDYVCYISFHSILYNFNTLSIPVSVQMHAYASSCFLYMSTKCLTYFLTSA